jgi:hypothetical protein
MRRGILPVCLLASFCGGAALAAPGALADDRTGAADIAVEYQYPYLTVQVSRPTHLLAILEELCQRTEASCDLGPQLAEIPFAPVTVRGTWFEVVSKLLEGTKLDFATIAPSPRQAGRLLVMTRISPNEGSRGEQTSQTGAGISPGYLPFPAGLKTASPNHGTQPEQSASPSGATELSQGQTGAPLGGAGGGAQHGAGDAIAESSIDQASQPAGGGEIPLADQIRNAEAIRNLYYGPPPGLPLPPPGMAVLPYPDQNGNPILVGISNQPMTQLLYPDAQGRPIEVPPGVPGLKVQHPFQATASSSPPK